MLRYFPFGERYHSGMGARPLQAGEPLCEVDPARYAAEVGLKRRLLSETHAEYFRGGSQTLPAQWATLALVLENLAAAYPAQFSLEQRGAEWLWRNHLLGEVQAFQFGAAHSLPFEPLDWAGRQVQEDLVLLAAEAEQRILGGQLCFANSWSIASHLGRPFMDIHAPTPQATMPSVHAGSRLIANLKEGKTVWRLNWNFKLSDELDLSTRHQARYEKYLAERAPLLSKETIGQALFVRVERQTLTRLAGTGAVLFGIHTDLSRLDEEASDPRRARAILSVVQSAPPDVKEYKALTHFEDPLVAYLEERI